MVVWEEGRRAIYVLRPARADRNKVYLLGRTIHLILSHPFIVGGHPRPQQQRLLRSVPNG